MKTHNHLLPAFVPPPGDTLRDELTARGWTQKHLARKMGRPIQAVNEILRGRRQITAETALALADVLGTSAELWLGLEMRYRLHLARQSRHPKLSA